MRSCLPGCSLVSYCDGLPRSTASNDKALNGLMRLKKVLLNMHPGDAVPQRIMEAQQHQLRNLFQETTSLWVPWKAYHRMIAIGVPSTKHTSSYCRRNWLLSLRAWKTHFWNDCLMNSLPELQPSTYAERIVNAAGQLEGCYQPVGIVLILTECLS